MIDIIIFLYPQMLSITNLLVVEKKGDLEKLIKFNPIPGNPQIYKLALGTIEENGHIDKLARPLPYIVLR